MHGTSKLIRPIFVKLSLQGRELFLVHGFFLRLVRVGNKAAFRSPDKEFAVPLNMYVLL
jgi:hypothetical protein